VQTLEERIHSLNSQMQAFAWQHADDIGTYFDPSSRKLEGVRDSRLSCCVGDRMPVPPALVPAAVADRFARCHLALRAALDLIFEGRLECSWDRLAEALRLEEPTFRYIDPARRPRWLTIARPDVVIHDNDITIVEPNGGSSCGYMPDADILGRLFEDSPHIGAFLRKLGARRTSVMGALANYLRGKLADAHESPGSALILVAEFKEDLGGPCDDCHGLAQELRRQGLRADAAAIEDLEVSGSGVAYAGERCALLYRVAGEEPDPVRNYPMLAPILACGRRGKVIVVDDLDDAIAVNKTILATVSEELDSGRLPAQLRDDLATFVPWSRVLEQTHTQVDGERVDLPAWCLANREALVLKPGAGYGGRGVTIGCETNPALWATAVDNALSSGEAWLVQRLACSHPTMTSISRCGSLAGEETFVDYAYFAVGDAIPTAIVRKSPPFGSPTRRVKNGGCGPVFIV
jgi:hypothetical protein